MAKPNRFWKAYMRPFWWNGMEWNRLAGTGVATAQKIVQRPTPFLSRLPLRGWEGFLQWTISPTITCVQASTHRPERPFYWKRNRNAKEITKSCCHRPNRDLVFRKIKEAPCSVNSIHHSQSGVPEFDLPNKNLVLEKIEDGTNPSQPASQCTAVGAWYRENKCNARCIVCKVTESYKKPGLKKGFLSC